MIFKDLQRRAAAYYPALFIDDLISRRVRHGVRRVVYYAAIILLVSVFLAPQYTFALGVFYLALALWLILVAIDSFYNSYYFRDLTPTEGESAVSIEVADIIRRSSRGDVTLGLLRSPYGRMVCMRLGITRQNIKTFTQKRRRSPQSFAGTVDKKGMLLFSDIAEAVCVEDKELQGMLFAEGLQKRQWNGSVLWVERTLRSQKRRERWWGRDRLGRIPGVGKDWAYGRAFDLERYAHEVTGEYGGGASAYHKDEFNRLEGVLSRAKESNALLVGEEGVGKRDMVARLARDISRGTVLPELAHKRIYVLDSNALVISTGDKISFERELTRIMQGSVHAGNVILVIEDLPAFIRNAGSLGSDVMSIMDPYLSSSTIQIIALSDPAQFRNTLENTPHVMKRFEHILVESGQENSIVELLETEVGPIEAASGIFFTYPALELIVENAERFFSDGSLKEKSIDLIIELVPMLQKAGKRVVHKEDVLALVEAKTGVPVSAITKEEKEKLLQLETVLQSQVVGQDEAVGAIANAMRRARSGVGNTSRPMGSFLFLGPTGVGKTETTKALARTFFGSEDKILRFDMSEFNGPDAVERLIGSFKSVEAGILAARLREHPYGVLLLDEFEKATREVHDLFLQILDEGFFSDAHGKRVYARNTIIIATSNAGSDLIWQYAKESSPLSLKKSAIIDEIIRRGTFKPELLNRFDGVILFHPLKDAQLSTIARMMLEKLNTRLKAKGLELHIDQPVIDFLVKEGSDPQFGARPLNRAIQEKIESKIAEKMIKGELQSGSKVTLSAADLA